MGHHKKNEMNVVINSKPVKASEKNKSKSKQQIYKRASSVPLNNNYNHQHRHELESELNSNNSSNHSNRSVSPTISLVSNIENENIKNDFPPTYEYLNEADSKELLRRLQAEYTQLVL